MFSETDIINMLEFVIDNTFAMFGGRVFQWGNRPTYRKNCDPLIGDVYFYSHVGEFIQRILKKNKESYPDSWSLYSAL